jgi:hypothetical protein
LVQVLTTGSWPTQAAAKCNLPRELEKCCEEFKAFYLASHSGRKLSWQTNMGHAGARATASSDAWCSHVSSACTIPCWNQLALQQKMLKWAIKDM